MLILGIVLGYALVGTIELMLWTERPSNKVAIYLILLAAAAAFSVLMVVNPYLRAFSPIETLRQFLVKLKDGGGLR